MEENAQRVIRYHERTKHHPDRYARSPGFLDWANEPAPFRRYEGATFLPLSLSEDDPEGDYRDLYERGNNTFRPFSLNNISLFFGLSLGLSAWKSYGGAKWALRMNPSSGNLHPTEAYAILAPLPENNHLGGVCHYSPFFHALEFRAGFDERFWLLIRDYFETDGFFVGLSSIYWRESWKYGERAFRYCNHDIGHAIAALSLAGNLLGWKITWLDALSDQDAGTLMGFPKTKWILSEAENPEAMFFVHGTMETNVPRDIPQEIIDSFESLSYSGEPNRLSREHVDWKVIEEASSASEKPRGTVMRHGYPDYPFYESGFGSQRAASVLRQRRSALAFDTGTPMPKEHFLGMLDRTLPRGNAAPFDLGLGETSVHLFIFVHRISGLEPGLYFFLRDEAYLKELKRRCRPNFLWKKIIVKSGSAGLYLLKRGDFRDEGARAG